MYTYFFPSVEFCSAGEFLGRIARTQCMDAIYCYIQMSHVAWSVCLCVGHMGELWTGRDAVWGMRIQAPLY